MSKVQTLRAFVNQRLTAAAEEIFELFERTVAEYEEELWRQSKLLNAVFIPEVRLHRADVQQLLVNKEAVPPEQQQEWSPLLDQEDPPELPHIKEEQEELLTNQEAEQLRGPEEAEITRYIFPPVAAKREEDEDKPPSSQLHHRQTKKNRDAERLKTEADEEDCGEPEPDRNFNPGRLLRAAAHDQTPHFSEPGTDGRYDWGESRDPQSGFIPLQNNKEPVSNTGKVSVRSSECAASFEYKGRLQKHNGIQTEGKSLSGSVCGKRCTQKDSLRSHMRLHSEGKRFSCSVCKKTFQWRGDVVRHMRIHTGEKPFSCSVCGKRFSRNSTLTTHLRVHTGEKPFTCSVCEASFSLRSNMSKHMRIHTGEKPFSCSVCGKTFVRKGHLRQHLLLQCLS